MLCLTEYAVLLYIARRERESRWSRSEASRAYRAWMQTGSVSLAAEQLGVTQPGVSRALHELSATLRVPLFTREGRSLAPTRESFALYSEVDQILEKVAGIADISDNLRSSQERQLHVAATPAPALGILPATIKSFAADFPDVEVAMDMCMPRDLNDWRKSGRSTSALP